VLCTHGEVIGQVLTLLAADGLEVDQPLVWPKGSTWVLDGVNGRRKVGRYLPPLPLTDALIVALQARWKTPAPGLPLRVQEGPWQPSHQDPDGRPATVLAPLDIPLPEFLELASVLRLASLFADLFLDLLALGALGEVLDPLEKGRHGSILSERPRSGRREGADRRRPWVSHASGPPDILPKG
jgi:hypothetical protein